MTGCISLKRYSTTYTSQIRLGLGHWEETRKSQAFEAFAMKPMRVFEVRAKRYPKVDASVIDKYRMFIIRF